MSELEKKLEINLLKHIQVVLFTENGRLLYQLKQQAGSTSLAPVPMPTSALATSNSEASSVLDKHISSNNCHNNSCYYNHNNNNDCLQKRSIQQNYSNNHDVIRRIQPSTNGVNVQSQKSTLSALSECIFGSVSIQSLPNICVSKIHHLNVDTIMMSLVFEMQPQQSLKQQQPAKMHKHQQQISTSTSSTSSRPSSQPIKHRQHNTNHNSNLPSKRQETKMSPGTNHVNIIHQQLNVRKKLGLALIWDSIEEQLDLSGRNIRDFIFDYSKAIDFHLNVLKDYISNTQALSSKLIHASVLNCLQSINELANASFVSNLEDFTEEDFVEEFVSLIEELELKTTNYTMSTILTVLLSSDHLQDLQVVLTSQNPDTKVLIMRILFVIRCLLFDEHLALLKSQSSLNTAIKKNTCFRRQNDDSHLYDSRSIVIKDSNSGMIDSSSSNDQFQGNHNTDGSPFHNDTRISTEARQLSEVKFAIPRSKTHSSLLNEPKVAPKTDNQFLLNRSTSKNNYGFNEKVSNVSKEKLSSSYDNTNLDTNINKTNLFGACTNGDEISTTMLAKSKLYMREYQSLRFSGPSSLPHAYSIASTSDGGLSRSASGSVTNISQESTRGSTQRINSDFVTRQIPETSLISRTSEANTTVGASIENTSKEPIDGTKNDSRVVQSTSFQTYSTTSTNTNIPIDQLNISINIRPITEGSLVGFAQLDPLEFKPETAVQFAGSRATPDLDRTRRKEASRRSFADASVSATSGMFEFLQEPRVFHTKPLIYLQPSYPNLGKIYEPVITSNYLISCALQCIITGQTELVNEKIKLAPGNDRILHIDCDNWSTRMISCGILKTVVLSSVVMDACNVMKQMKLFKVDTKLIIEYFYSKLAEEIPCMATSSLNSLNSSPLCIVADISETCL